MNPAKLKARDTNIVDIFFVGSLPRKGIEKVKEGKKKKEEDEKVDERRRMRKRRIRRIVRMPKG